MTHDELVKLVFGGDIAAILCGGKELFRIGVNGVTEVRRKTVSFGRNVADKPMSLPCLMAYGDSDKYLGCVFPGPGVSLEMRVETKELMTPEEFLSEMNKIAGYGGYDKMERHENMDELMCKVLTERGYGAGVEVFIDTDKWYA